MTDVDIPCCAAGFLQLLLCFHFLWVPFLPLSLSFVFTQRKAPTDVNSIAPDRWNGVVTHLVAPTRGVNESLMLREFTSP